MSFIYIHNHDTENKFANSLHCQVDPIHIWIAFSKSFEIGAHFEFLIMSGKRAYFKVN